MSDTIGVAQFYYGRQLPARAVALSQVTAKPTTPGDLADIANVDLAPPLGAGPLTITQYPGGQVFPAADLNVAVHPFGSLMYLVENQFFEVTPIVSDAGRPLFYRHPFDMGNVENVGLLDLDGNGVSGFELRDNILYHSLDGRPYWVRYYADGVLRTELLNYQPVMTRTISPTAFTYAFNPGGLLTLFAMDGYWIRFTKRNGYLILPPYSVPSNDPWYPRIRFSLRPIAKEWARQVFLPVEPYMLATWVPGTVLAANLVEFERQPAYFDGLNYPDILVYDKDYQLKYALDGSEPNSRVDKGYLFPWVRSQFIGMDPAHARCHVAVDLAPTDLCFGFYDYAEKDVVFRDLDVNPFSNPLVKDKVIEFYFADRGDDIPPRSGPLRT